MSVLHLLVMALTSNKTFSRDDSLICIICGDMTLSVDNITSSIKTVGWLICSRPPLEPALEPRQKTG